MDGFTLAIIAMGFVTLAPSVGGLWRSWRFLSAPVLVGAFFSYFYFFTPLKTLSYHGPSLFYGDRPYIFGIFVAMGALLSFYLGWLLAKGWTCRRGRPPVFFISRSLFHCGLALCIIAFAGRFYFISLVGGWRHFFSQPHFLATRGTYVSAYVYDLWRLAIPGIILMLQSFLRPVRTAWLRPRALTTVFFSVAILSMAIATGARQDTFYLLASWMIVTAFTRYKPPSRVALASWLLAVGLSPLLLLAYRPYIHLGSDLNQLSNVDTVQFMRKALKPDTGDEFVMHSALVTACYDLGRYDYGLNILYIPVNFIPRTLWPEKPYNFFEISPASLIQERWGWNPAGGSAVTGAASVFFEFGFGSLFLWFCLGLFLRRSYNSASTRNPLGIAVYASLVCAMFQFVAQDIWVGIMNAIFILVPLYVAYKFSRTAPFDNAMCARVLVAHAENHGAQHA